MVVWNQSGDAISDIVLYTTSAKLGWSFVLFTVLWSIHALLVTLSINSVTAGQSGTQDAVMHACCGGGGGGGGSGGHGGGGGCDCRGFGGGGSGGMQWRWL